MIDNATAPLWFVHTESERQCVQSSGCRAWPAAFADPKPADFDGCALEMWLQGANLDPDEASDGYPTEPLPQTPVECEVCFTRAIGRHEILHKHAHCIEPLTLLMLGIIEADEACELTRASLEELTAAADHEPTAQVVEQLGAKMRIDGRANNAIARRRLQAILRDPAATHKEALNAASALRLCNDAGQRPPTEAQIRVLERFRRRNIEIASNRKQSFCVRAHAANILLNWEYTTRAHIR